MPETTNGKSVSTILKSSDPSSQAQTSSQARSTKKSILPKTKLNLVPVIWNNLDVTPKHISPNYYEALISGGQGGGGDKGSVSQLKIAVTKAEPSAAPKVDISARLQELQQQATVANLSLSQFVKVCDDLVLETASAIEPQTGVEEEYDINEFDKELDQVPDSISFTLNETETFFLLDLPSYTELRTTDLGRLIETDNAAYAQLTESKFTTRKVKHIDCQTTPILLKCRDTETVRHSYKDAVSFTSAWEMYDTYNTNLTMQNDQKMKLQYLHQLQDLNADNVKSGLNSDEEFCQQLVEKSTFWDAIEIIEHFLAYNNYAKEQRRFVSTMGYDLISENPTYKYDVIYQWTFLADIVDGKAVTALEWSRHNPELLAVGYGVFTFHRSKTKGHVLLWNIKNPTQPERCYTFPEPVTCLSFSLDSPNILAVGFTNGTIELYNVSERDVNLAKQYTLQAVKNYHPVWQIQWIKVSGDEELIAIYDNGKVIKFTITSTHVKYAQVMRIARTDGTLKGISIIKKCSPSDITVCHYSAARVIALHPNDPNQYLIGSSEGVVYKCSLNYLNRHMDIFLAHEGAITSLRFSPFARHLFATCGDDGRFRIWVDSIQHPLTISPINLSQINGFEWSPSHSTIFATIRESFIFIWDYQRKLHSPHVTTQNPNNFRNTTLKFTANGGSLVVGDVNGGVHVYALDDLPRPAYFQENLLYQTLKRPFDSQPEIFKAFYEAVIRNKVWTTLSNG